MNKKIFLFGLCIILLSSFTYAVCNTGDLATNNLLYYKLEETGTPYDDAVGNLDLTVANTPDRTTGVIDFGQDFTPANDDYLATASTTIMDESSFSWSFWYKPETSSGVQKPINYYINSGSYYGFVLNYENNVLEPLGFKGSSSSNFKTTTSTTLTVGSWQMVTITYDGSEFDVFIDGTEASYSTQGSGTVAHISQDIVIGVDATTYTSSEVNGIMDEIAFFNGVLSQDCIDFLYNSGAPTENEQYPYTSSSTCDCSSIQAGTAVDCSENCDIDDCDANLVDLVFYGIGKITLIGDLILDSFSIDRTCEFNNEHGDGNRLIIKND